VVLFIGKIHILDIECFSYRNWSNSLSEFLTENEMAPILMVLPQIKESHAFEGPITSSPHERARPLINLATTSYSEEEIWKILDIQSRCGGQDYVISRIDFQMPFFRSLWWSSEFQLPFLWRLFYGLIIEVKKDRTSHYTSAFFLGQKIGEFFFSINLTFKKNLHAWD
jgi:hypothetical protein